ncbi:TonB-dependent receptor [Novosphingobium sp. KACC 22771]|uniref:TonB-dependent receptor n=1 Tax=Novosphingobium sp. KACC 22771 TaxID=3025670 RepID=UPI002365C15B|nr:TonB-dependent receptor [Novosphingobium sp. KACC 22771]WDF75075.1 TonB-dependent receptor [Novosphingobium sp. KACC 22771]
MKYSAILLASAALFPLATPALAQNSAAASEPITTEIVVTAQKSSEKISKAPIAVSVVSQAALDRQSITSADRLVSTVPSLQLSQNGFAIRGIGSNNGFSGYSTVATQFDGIYNPSSVALGLAMFDIGSVEVLRGPQGTVYGRNATAGVVNINSADPGKQLGGSASLQYGRFNDIRAQVAVDLPVSDTFGLRVAAFRQVNDGYGAQLGTTRFDKADLGGVRLTAKWAITPTLTWRVSGSYAENNGTVPTVYLRNYNYYPQANLTAGTFGPVTIIPTRFDTVNPGLDQVRNNRLNVKSYDVRSKLMWQATDSLSLTWLAGYSSLVNNGVAAATGVFSQEYINHKTNSWSQELDVNFQRGPVKLVAGAYIYQDEIPSGMRLLHAGNTAPAPFASVYNLFGSLVASTGNQIGTINAVDVVNNYSGEGSKSRALFGQGTFSLTDRLRATAGVRATWDDVNGREQQLVCPGGTVTRANISATTCPGGFALAYTDDRGRAAASFSKVSWKAGLDYDLTPGILAYATVSTGYRGGGLQSSGNPTAYQQYAPETVTNYEAGLRAKLLGDRLFIGLTGYQMDYQNLQVSSIVVDPVQGPIAVTTNAAKARIRGVDLETTYRPTRNDTISGYLAYMVAEYRSFPGASDNLHSADTMYNIFGPILGYAAIPSASADYSGKRLTNAPQFSARFSYAHSFDLASGGKITPSVDFYAQSKTFASSDNAVQGRIAGYTKTDLNLRYDEPSGHAYINLFMNNVEDRRIATTVVPVWSSTTASYAPPRTYGVRLGFKY